MDIAALSIQFLAILLVLTGGLAALRSRSIAQATRLARLERKVDAILEHLSVDFVDKVDPKIVELLAAGKKIEAIKAYREQSGVGLNEAKEYVESL